MAAPRRIVALGASNLTRGFGSMVASARAAWGPGLEVLAAPGLGRSYGLRSAVFGRRMPSILECGLWAALDALPRVPTRALVTDVGNDILYGATVAQIVAWVGESVDRLRAFTDDVVLTGLPLARIAGLSAPAFVFFRTALVPRCRLSRAETLAAAVAVDGELRALAERRRVRFVELPLEWYGADPVHIRPRQWTAAWHLILTGEPLAGRAGRPWTREALRLFLMKPERRWWLGIEQRGAQPGLRLPDGSTVSCY
jgi:hypothetical protein